MAGSQLRTISAAGTLEAPHRLTVPCPCVRRTSPPSRSVSQGVCVNPAKRAYSSGWPPVTLVLVLLLAPAPMPEPAAAQDSRGVLQSLQDAFVQVAQSVKPAVVNIATTQRPRPQEGRRPSQVPPFRGPFRDFFGEDFFERFFGERPQRERGSLGSGVLVDKRGYILTNNHVIEQADQIEVRLPGKRKFTAAVIGKDPKTDLAVIKIDAPDDLPVARL